MNKEFDNINGEFFVCDTQARNNVDDLKNIIKGVSLSIEFFPKEEEDTSDLERIQRAIDSLTTGGTIYIPNGIYTIKGSILMKPNITIIGESINGCELNCIGNYSMFKSYQESETDNFNIKNIKLTRNASQPTKPFIDMTYMRYCLFENVYIYSNDNQQLSPLNTAIKLGDTSYYNLFVLVQIRYFYNGYIFTDSANGNIVLGGSCISCGNYGVYISNVSNSNKFYGHTVELSAQAGYVVDSGSDFNEFFGCRCESITYSYIIEFESGNSPINNIIWGGLDFSTKGKKVNANSNANVSSLNFIKLQQRSNQPMFYANNKYGQGPSNAGEYRQLMTPNLVQVRGDLASISGNYCVLKAPNDGIYCIEVSVDLATTQSDDIIIALYKNGSKFIENKVVNKSNFIVSLEKDDLITCYVKTSTTSNINGTNKTYFTGYEI